MRALNGPSDYALAFVQRAIAMNLAFEAFEPADVIAERRWGRASVPAFATKAAVAGAATTSGAWGAELAQDQPQQEFVEYLRELELLTRMGAGLVPADTPVLFQTQGLTAHWRGQGKAAPLSAAVYEKATLRADSIAATLVTSKDVLRQPAAEPTLARDLRGSIVDGVNFALLDLAGDGTGAAPASLTFGAPSIASVGDLAEDLRAMLTLYAGDPARGVFMARPDVAVGLTLIGGGEGLTQDLGLNGGSLLGAPFFTVRSAPAGTLVLVDASAVRYVDEGVALRISTEASLEMTDGPTADSTTPTAAASLVNLWQGEGAALQASRRLNWMRARADSTVVLTGLAGTSTTS